MWYTFPSYLSMSSRRDRAERTIARYRKQGIELKPVVIGGRTIASTYWGKRWCDYIETLDQYSDRIRRGRSYVTNGLVCHLEINPGRIESIVCGGSTYEVSIKVQKLARDKWDAIRAACTGQVSSLLELLQGQLSENVMAHVAGHQYGLFPDIDELEFECSCPDWSGLCKHVAATLYGVGARLDQSPELLFQLRGVDHTELVDSGALSVAIPKGTRPRLSVEQVQEIFGIDASLLELPPEPVSDASDSGFRNAFDDDDVFDEDDGEDDDEDDADVEYVVEIETAPKNEPAQEDEDALDEVIGTLEELAAGIPETAIREQIEIIDRELTQTAVMRVIGALEELLQKHTQEMERRQREFEAKYGTR